MNFMAKTTIERTNPGVRTKVEEAGFLGNVFVRPDGLGILKSVNNSWSNSHRPRVSCTRSVFSTKSDIGGISAKVSSVAVEGSNAGYKLFGINILATSSPGYPELKTALEKLQTPASADPMSKFDSF